MNQAEENTLQQGQIIPLQLLVKQFCLFLGIIAVLLLLVYYIVPYADFLEQEAIKQVVVSYGWQGIALFLLAGVVFMVLAGARQLVAVVSGYVFGFCQGFLWSFVITCTACCVLFFAARCVRILWIGKPKSCRVKNKYLVILQKVFTQAPFLGTVVFRFLPLGSNYIFTLFAGWSAMRALPFFAGSFLGYMPQVLIFVLIGSGIGQNWWNVALAAVLFVCSILLGFFLYVRISSR